MTESAEGAERELVFGPVISGPAAVAVHKRLLELEAECASLKSTNSKLREELIGNVKNMKSQFDGSGLIREGHNVACDSFIRVIEALASKESESGK